MTPIALAAAEGQWEAAKDLAVRNPNLEAKDNYGITPIALAAAFCQWEVVKDLAARNVNLEAKDNFSMTPIAWATFKALVEAKNDKYGSTPIALAAAEGQWEVVKDLTTLWQL
jgi:ankyrin repeat protein